MFHGKSAYKALWNILSDMQHMCATLTVDDKMHVHCFIHIFIKMLSVSLVVIAHRITQTFGDIKYMTSNISLQSEN